MPISAVYSRTLTVTKDVIDGNGHVNNVVYVQWMQDIAVEHYASLGGIPAQDKDATWVIREHRIEYLLPVLEGEQIEVRTWVENIRRVRSLRRYEFIRMKDGRTAVRGETEWVFVDAKTGRPRAVPDEIIEMLQNT